MAFTQAHLRTLSVEQLETLKELHGDTLTDSEQEKIDKIIAEKREGESEETSGEETEPEKETETESENEAQDAPPAWWKDPPSADEVADKFLERLAEAETVADEATRKDGESEKDKEGDDEKEKSEVDTEEESDGKTKARKTEKDDAPETEHFWYRDRRKKKVTSE